MERMWRVLSMAAGTQDSNEREEMVSTRTWMITRSSDKFLKEGKLMYNLLEKVFTVIHLKKTEDVVNS